MDIFALLKAYCYLNIRIYSSEYKHRLYYTYLITRPFQVVVRYEQLYSVILGLNYFNHCIFKMDYNQAIKGGSHKSS